MSAGFSFTQAKGGAAVDDLTAVVNVASEHLFHVHLLRTTVIERQENDTKGTYEWCAFVELVDNYAWNITAFELDHYACSFSRFVA